MASVVLSADYYDQPLSKSPHYHDCHQIVYVTSGSATIRFDDHTCVAKAGSLVIFSRFEHHAVTANSDDYHRYVLEIAPMLPISGPNGYQIFSILYNRPDGFSNLIELSEAQTDIETLIRQIVHEQNHPAPFGDETKDLLIQQLLISLFRQFPENFPQFNENTFQLVYQIQKKIETDYSSHITLLNLSEEYSLSVSYLSHIFKKVTGSSVIDYLMSCRLAAAKHYLVQTSMRVGEIVEICGFSDTSNFSRFFKNKTGCSPSRFRQIYHGL